MLLLLIIYFFSDTTARLFNPGEFEGNGISNYARTSYNDGVRTIIGKPLWVLLLNNDVRMDPKLKLGTSADFKDFYFAFSPMIRNRQRSRLTATTRVSKINSTNALNTRSNEDLKKDILKIINKFVLYTNEEPDSYLTGNEDQKDPSVALYFQDDLTCMSVKSGDKQWDYLLNNMPFPNWFYQPHDTFEAPLKIPEDITNRFYQKLLYVLTTLLLYPL